MKILAIDTSTQTLSVAIVDGRQALVEVNTYTKKTHGERLIPTIEWAFDQSPYSIKEMDRIAVAKGPGSYTGLRIAATAAKTLAWTLDKELVAVSSLAVLAANAFSTEGLLVPLFDARRENIYTGLYRNDSGSLVEQEADRHVSAQEFARYLSQEYTEDVYLVGEDAKLFYDVFEAELGERLAYAEVKSQQASAVHLAHLAVNSQPVDVHTFEPAYLKLTEAEENWLKDHPDMKEEDYEPEITGMDE